MGTGELQRLRNMFEELDSDDSGDVSIAELRTVRYRWWWWWWKVVVVVVVVVVAVEVVVVGGGGYGHGAR